jgi:hypothetical protein
MNAATRRTRRGLEFLGKDGIVSVCPCVGAADRATEQMMGSPEFGGGLPIGFMACCYIERNIEQRLGTSTDFPVKTRVLYVPVVILYSIFFKIY